MVIYLTTKPYPGVERLEEEEFYKDPKSKNKIKFPSIQDPYSVNLSVIVPAYNEEERRKFYIPVFTIATHSSNIKLTYQKYIVI